MRARRGQVGRIGAELSILAVAISFYAAFIARSGFAYGGKTYYVLADDAMISMRYARNLAHGNGLVWNVGQHVEGYTNTLWTLWMGAVHLMPLSDATAGLPVMVSGAALLVATMLVARSICVALVPDRRFVPLMAMALVGLCYPLVFWSLRGMETGIGSLLILVGVRVALALRTGVTGRLPIALGVSLSAAVLTRDDLVVPAAVIVAFAVHGAEAERRRRVLAVAGGAVILTLVAHAIFRAAYYGEALPNTYYLKLSGIPLGTRLHRGVVGLAYTSLTSLHGALALATVCVIAAWRSPRFPPVALLAAVVASQCLYSVYVGGDFAEDLRIANRFVATATPPLMVLAAIGASDLVAVALATRARRTAGLLGVGVLLAASLVQRGSWSATRVLEFAGAPSWSTARVAIALAGAAILVATGIWPPTRARPYRRWLRGSVAGMLALTALAAVDYAPVRDWGRANAPDLPPARAFALEGAALHQNTTPAASIAFVAAGNAAYFSHRRGVDLLGKVDPVIAREKPHRGMFQPGHDKWNYAYSIGALRPDVVTGLWHPTSLDLCHMAAWGYRQLASDFWVRTGTRNVYVGRLALALLRAGEGPPLRRAYCRGS